MVPGLERGKRLARALFIQFGDIPAGLSDKHFNSNLNGDGRAFVNELINQGLASISSNRLVASGEFPIQIPPKRLDGPDVVDQLACMLRDRLC